MRHRCSSPPGKTSTGYAARTPSRTCAAPTRFPPPPARPNATVSNPGGDRDANRTLYLIAVIRLRYCPKTRTYANRRTTEGKSKKEIIRCLKRYIAREIYYTLRADLKNLAPTP
jgi:hypothetical protein